MVPASWPTTSEKLIPPIHEIIPVSPLAVPTSRAGKTSALSVQRSAEIIWWAKPPMENSAMAV